MGSSRSIAPSNDLMSDRGIPKIYVICMGSVLTHTMYNDSGERVWLILF